MTEKKKHGLRVTLLLDVLFFFFWLLHRFLPLTIMIIISIIITCIFEILLTTTKKKKAREKNEVSTAWQLRGEASSRICDNILQSFVLLGAISDVNFFH